MKTPIVYPYNILPEERIALHRQGMLREPPVRRERETKARFVLRQVKAEIAFLEAARRALPDAANKDRLDGAMFAYQRMQEMILDGGV